MGQQGEAAAVPKIADGVMQFFDVSMRERYSRSIQSSGIIIIVKLNILNI
jgi:hypothetical protein